MERLICSRAICKLRALARIALAGVAALSLAACSPDPGTTAKDVAPAAPAPVAEASSSSVAGAGGSSTNEPLEVRNLLGWYFAVLIDRGAESDPQGLVAMVRSLCDGVAPCNVGMWDDRDQMPTKMPVSGDQINAQVFALGRTAAGADWALWNCDVFPQYEKDHLCLPQRR